MAGFVLVLLLFLFIIGWLISTRRNHTNNTDVVNDEETDSLMRYDEENINYNNSYEEEPEYNYNEPGKTFNEGNMVDVPEYWESQGIEPEERGY